MAPHNFFHPPGPPGQGPFSPFDPTRREKNVAAAAIDWILIVLGPILVCSFGLQAFRRGTLEFTRDGWLRFPIAFALGLGATFSLAELYAFQVPTVTRAHPVYVTLSYIALAYLCTHIPLRLAAIFRPTADQKTTILLQIYSFWWLAAIFNCSGSFPDIRVFRYSPIFHVTALCTLLITLENLNLSMPRATETIVSDTADSPLTELPRDTTRDTQDPTIEEMSPTVTPPDTPSSPSMWLRVLSKVSRRGPIALSESSDDDLTLNNPEPPVIVRRPAPVIAALAHHLRRMSGCIRSITLRFARGPKRGPEKTKRGPMYWLTKVMVPITLGIQLAILLMCLLWAQSWREGLTALDIALIMALSSFLFVLPMAPFTHNFHPGVAISTSLFLLACVIYNLLAFPYTQDAPAKLFFTLRVSLEDGTTRVQVSTVPEAIKYLPAEPHLLECRPDSDQSKERGEAAGRTCEWPGLPLKMDPYPPVNWLNVSATPTGPYTGVVHIAGRQTFDHINFWKDEPGAPYPTQVIDCGGSEPRRPFQKHDLSGWGGSSRVWDRDYDHDTEGKEDIRKIGGEVAIVWAKPDLAKIPDFALINDSLPPWVEMALFVWSSQVKVVLWRGFKFD